MTYSLVSSLATALQYGASVPELMEICDFEGTEEEFRAVLERSSRRAAEDKKVRLDAAIMSIDKPEFRGLSLDELCRRADFLLRTFQA